MRIGSDWHREVLFDDMTADEAWSIFRQQLNGYLGRVELVENLGTGMTRTWCVRAAQKGERKPCEK